MRIGTFRQVAFNATLNVTVKRLGLNVSVR